MGTMFPDDDKYFNTTGSFNFTRSQAEMLVEDVTDVQELEDALVEKIISQSFEVGINGPTIIGPDDEFVMVNFYEEDFTVSYDTPGGTMEETLTVPGQEIDTGVSGYLEDMSMLPLFAPQLGVGTFMGTKLYARFIPPMDLGEFGDLSYWGVGAQHNIKAWLPVPLPIDISGALFTQQMKIGDIAEATATTMGVNVGKTLGLRFLSVTPYAGLMYEQAKMKFQYDYLIGNNPVTNEPMRQKISFELDGDNNSRMVLGAAFRLGVFNLSADYNIGKYNSVTTSFGIAF